MMAPASQTAGRDHGNARTAGRFARYGRVRSRSGSAWESCPALSAPRPPTVDHETHQHQRQHNGAQPLRGGDRPDLNSGHAASASTGFLRALRGRLVDAGFDGADPFARTQATASNCLERKTPATDTARASACAPAPARAGHRGASFPGDLTHANPAPKFRVRDPAAPLPMDGPEKQSPEFSAFEIPLSPARIFFSNRRSQELT